MQRFNKSNNNDNKGEKPQQQGCPGLTTATTKMPRINYFHKNYAKD